MTPELTTALALANRILDRPNADPDDDLALLARQLVRQSEAVERLKQALAEWRSPVLERLLKIETPPKIQPVVDHTILDLIFGFLRHHPPIKATRESECIEFDDSGKHWEIVVREIDERSSEP